MMLILFSLLPPEQAPAQVCGTEPQRLANMVKAKDPIAVRGKDPFLGLVEDPFPFAVARKPIVLIVANGIFQDRQHQPFLRFEEGLAPQFSKY